MNNSTHRDNEAAPPTDRAANRPNLSDRKPHLRIRLVPDWQSLPHATCADEPSPRFVLGIQQFNQREYFECHETLEGLWNDEPGPVRTLYKGILQVGVGCYHLLRGNAHGALIKLESGADYLEAFAPRCLGVDVAQLIADARHLRAELVALGPARIADIDRRLLPVVRFAGVA